MQTVDALFAHERDAAIELLMNDPSSYEKLLQQAGPQLQDCPQALWHYPHEQITSLAMSSGISSAEEAIYVGYMVDHYMANIKDVFPMISEHHGLALAERCFVSLSFFRDYMQKKTTRHGAPSPDFYRSCGQSAFRVAGWESLADNFAKWNDFWREQFDIANF